jgi:hypothetical protein
MQYIRLQFNKINVLGSTFFNSDIVNNKTLFKKQPLPIFLRLFFQSYLTIIADAAIQSSTFARLTRLQIFLMTRYN